MAAAGQMAGVGDAASVLPLAAVGKNRGGKYSFGYGDGRSRLLRGVWGHGRLHAAAG